MPVTTAFGEVLEVVSNLPLDEQEMLINILQNRLVELRRNELKSDVQKSRRDFAKGNYKAATVDEIMREVLP